MREPQELASSSHPWVLLPVLVHSSSPTRHPKEKKTRTHTGAFLPLHIPPIPSTDKFNWLNWSRRETEWEEKTENRGQNIFILLYAERERGGDWMHEWRHCWDSLSPSSAFQPQPLNNRFLIDRLLLSQIVFWLNLFLFHDFPPFFLSYIISDCV